MQACLGVLFRVSGFQGLHSLLLDTVSTLRLELDARHESRGCLTVLGYSIVEL